MTKTIETFLKLNSFINQDKHTDKQQKESVYGTWSGPRLNITSVSDGSGIKSRQHSKTFLGQKKYSCVYGVPTYPIFYRRPYTFFLENLEKKKNSISIF